MLDFVVRTRYSICIVNERGKKMFRIPSFNQMEMTWDEAVATIQGRGNGNLLNGMEEMNRIWNDHCEEGLDTDDDFFDHWVYEVNAYNVVFSGMSQLFGESA